MKRLSTSLLLTFCISFSVHAQTKWFVTSTASVTGGGLSWADPITFPNALGTAQAGDSIFVMQGTYQAVSGQSFSMKEGVKIYGGFAGTELYLMERNLQLGFKSILRGNNGRTIVNGAGITTAALLDGFTINGGAASYGAGMFNNQASPTISNCVFSDNHGGGMYNASSSASIINCVFAGNQPNTLTTYGGGITNARSPNVTVINCVFSQNLGYWGGAIYIDDVAPISIRIINCTFWGNDFVNNGGAGAIYCGARSSPVIQNCIISGNHVAMVIQNTLIPTVVTQSIIQDGYNANWNTNPLFVNIANPIGPDNIWGTADDGLKIPNNSPAANSGTNTIPGIVLPATDVTGAVRVQGNKIDMGAYETSFTPNAYNTLFVDGSVAASGDGGNWTNAFKTLDEAMLAAGQQPLVSSIHVAKGTYKPTLRTSFGLMNNLNLYGGFPTGGGSMAQRNTNTNETILNGNGKSIIFNESIDATALLDGFTISNGTALHGAGMYNIYSSPVISNCRFINNTATPKDGSGGAIYNRSLSLPRISNCIFSNNTASTTPLGGGGAISSWTANAIISDCIFTNNRSAYGGALYNSGSTSYSIKNSVFDGNICTGDGGAIANMNSNLDLKNVTFVNNHANNGGGAIDHYNNNVNATNVVFWGNTAASNPDIWHETGTMNVNNSFTQTSRAGTGNITGASSPFVDVSLPAGADGIWKTADDGIYPNATSPCINAGTPDTTGLFLGDTDIAGNPRILGTAIDIGAYERNSSALPVTLISFTGVLNNGIASLQWSTAAEINFNYFEIEKSTGSAAFQAVSKVPAKGSGKYTLQLPQKEAVAFYRLKMVDIDTRSKNSQIIRLAQKINEGLLAYPNPSNGMIYFETNEPGTVHLYSADGKNVKNILLQTGINAINIKDLPGGTYFAIMNGSKLTLIKR
ncbi:T9SS type A sorting domain-containing protein [Pseudoflavitalea sp. G-6-1-2]|uniref:choice-of-anchor Q domain-containing protein n=1 Tax=Pseudoflavitalea sp. G-6-1-2 TaxID=2728841 RepID=UPI00146D0C08|nr:choice-of-anchor Q domain-containing protein [Pseudoflavitalea sp. G-6-1-2]NML23569.1 T9SS type A sorting domain-containing protein [Pseudoflavitalea sp. G-6-1-2]